MRIAIDGYELQQRFTGVGRYLFNLLSAILALDGSNDYTLFLKEETDQTPRADNLRPVVIHTDISHTRWQNTTLRRHLGKQDFDLFFSPNHSLPLFLRQRSFMTIHDVSWRVLPRDYSLKERMVRDLKTRASCRRADLIFTDSHFSQGEILRYYPAAEGKIVPIQLGIDGAFRPASTQAVRTFKEKYGLDGGAVFGFLGSMFRRRHIDELLQAVEIVRKTRPVKLFLIGKDFYRGELCDRLSAPWVTWCERIEEDEVNAFYSALDLFVYPSDYEGFGFPPLEALQCGTVPVVSRTSSLGEVCESLAVYFENHTAEHMAAVLTDTLKRLPQIKADRLAVFEQHRPRFSWEQVARKYLSYFSP